MRSESFIPADTSSSVKMVIQDIRGVSACFEKTEHFKRFRVEIIIIRTESA